MKYTVAASLLLAATAVAVPLEARAAPDVRFALSNDQSGAYAGVTFSADGTDKRIRTLFGATSVGSSGHILASSGQLTQVTGGTSCVLKYNGVTATLNADRTYIDLDGNPAKATPVNLDNAVINCHA